MAFPITFGNPDFAAEWSKFEEAVSGDYLTNAGDVIQHGEYLLVTANKRGTSYSNKVGARKRVNGTGSNGIFTASVRVYVEADPKDARSWPEWGPELRIENTRLILGNHVTRTMGVKYYANQSSAHWEAHKEVSPGVGAWVQLGASPVLVPNQWYIISVTADMQNNIYTALTITDYTGIVTDLTPLMNGQPLAGELLYDEPSLDISLVAENYYDADHSRETPTYARVRYDDVNLEIA